MNDDKPDPAFSAYLAFLEGQIADRPELLSPIASEDLGGLGELLDGVVYDEKEALDDEFDLP